MNMYTAIYTKSELKYLTPIRPLSFHILCSLNAKYSLVWYTGASGWLAD